MMKFQNLAIEVARDLSMRSHTHFGQVHKLVWVVFHNIFNNPFHPLLDFLYFLIKIYGFLVFVFINMK